MEGRVRLHESQLNRKTLGKLFGLEPKTVYIKCYADNTMIGPVSGGIFPLRRLNLCKEWTCEGEPNKAQSSLKTYPLVKTSTIIILALSLLLIRTVLLLNIVESTNVSSVLEIISTVLLSVGIVFDIGFIYLSSVVFYMDMTHGSEDLDGRLGICPCCCSKRCAKNAQWYNYAMASMTLMLFVVSLPSIVCYYTVVSE
ncbi:uncharacterized protein LOC144357888 [Saccoglossus kowalevskii]